MTSGQAFPVDRTLYHRIHAHELVAQWRKILLFVFFLIVMMSMVLTANTRRLWLSWVAIGVLFLVDVLVCRLTAYLSELLCATMWTPSGKDEEYVVLHDDRITRVKQETSNQTTLEKYVDIPFQDIIVTSLIEGPLKDYTILVRYRRHSPQGGGDSSDTTTAKLSYLENSILLYKQIVALQMGPFQDADDANFVRNMSVNVKEDDWRLVEIYQNDNNYTEMSEPVPVGETEESSVLETFLHDAKVLTNRRVQSIKTTTIGLILLVYVARYFLVIFLPGDDEVESWWEVPLLYSGIVLMVLYIMIQCGCLDSMMEQYLMTPVPIQTTSVTSQQLVHSENGVDVDAIDWNAINFVTRLQRFDTNGNPLPQLLKIQFYDDQKEALLLEGLAKPNAFQQVAMGLLVRKEVVKGKFDSVATTNVMV